MKQMLIAAAVAAALPFAGHAAGIIEDGNVMLGVQDTGALNVGGGPGSADDGTTTVGVRYTPTGNEATAHGCLCEGWGVGIATAGGAAVASGYDGNGFSNLTVDSFVSDATTATSVTSLTSGELQVTHDFALSAESDNLYRVTVSIANTSGAMIEDLRYTRVMDWDVEPTTFSEYSTIAGTAAATAVLYANDDGFESANPFASRTPIVAGAEGDFVDSGPRDHGALFDFSFGSLGVDEVFTFDIFYGGAKTEREALISLAAVGAEVYSLGQPSHDPDGLGLDDPNGDASNTFIFGFSGVGGVVVPNPTAVPVPATGLLLAGGLGLLAARRKNKRA